VVTQSESLASVQKLDYVGGLAYLGALVQNVPTAANIRHYANIVRERSILRQLAATAGEIAESAFNPLGRNAKMVLDEAEAKVLHIAEQGARGAQNFQSIGALLATVVDRIETLYNRDDPSDVTRWASRASHSISANTLRSIRGSRLRCFRWRWARPSWRFVSSGRSASWISTSCAPDACNPTTGTSCRRRLDVSTKPRS